MRTAGTTAAVLALGLVAGLAMADEKKVDKPVISCDQVMKVYKDNQSVDETSALLKVDQARVAACLKAAGIRVPNEEDD